jgi:hypothetical protein
METTPVNICGSESVGIFDARTDTALGRGISEGRGIIWDAGDLFRGFTIFVSPFLHENREDFIIFVLGHEPVRQM